jgi:pilus assembly protein Flp/PilA
MVSGVETKHSKFNPNCTSPGYGLFDCLCEFGRPCSSTSGASKEGEMSEFLRFVRDEQGATAIEYALIAAGISVAIVAIVQGVGSTLVLTFTSVNTALR